MRQATAIDLYAGGPGSGCNPEAGKCGRPVGSGEQAKNWKKMSPKEKSAYGKQHTVYPKHPPVPKPKPVAAPVDKTIPHSGKPYTPSVSPQEGKTFKGPKGGAPVEPGKGPQYLQPGKYLGNLNPAPKNKYADRELIDKHPPKSGAAAELAWRAAHPGKPYPTTNLEPGDKAMLTKPFRTSVSKDGSSWKDKQFPIGTEVLVKAVSPPVAGEEHVVTIGIGKWKLSGYNQEVGANDLALTKKGEVNTPVIDVEPVKKSMTVSTSTTADGAKYTVVRPTGFDDEETRGTSKPHYLKGEFKNLGATGKNPSGMFKVIGEPYTRSVVFGATPKGVVPEWIKTGPEPEDLRQLGTAGTSLFVYKHYDTNRVVIREISTGQYGHSFRFSKTWEYKGGKTANNFLMKRYGIKQKMPNKI